MQTKTHMVATLVNMMAQNNGHVFDGAIFNDKLKNGRRSLKVQGWTDIEYFKAKRILESIGCKARIVRIPIQGGKSPNNKNHIKYRTRLHVTE